jgi:DNA-binding SARP family transcriptional activator/tetratricopeptide (TPR) repeat protein
VLRLLGPMQWEVAGRQVDLGPVKQRAVLAALAVDAGRVVTWSVLVHRVWDQTPPADARGVLYTYANRIRRVLKTVNAAAASPPVQLVRQPGGYVLEVDADRIDVLRFRRLVAAAAEPHRADVERVALLGEALCLWRAAPLADLSGDWAERIREGWGQQRLGAAVAWAAAALRIGRHEEVVGTVQGLAGEYPLAEPLTGLLMRALVATGRNAEALGCYATTRARLIDELGAEPGPELRALHQAVLRGEVPRPGPVPEPASHASPKPAQLPADVPAFIGRRAELAALDHLLTPARAGGQDQAGAPRDTSTPVVISAVSGTAGVGKTALALHWAHRIRARFPDGQLYVNLRGYDPDQPMTPSNALAGLLTGLGVSGLDIPLELEDRAARYRTEISGRRILVVLDNASSVEQVRPMLPGTPSAVVVVTSRDSLAGLVAVHGARRLDLDVLPLPDAIALLHALIGPRAFAEAQAAAELAGQCARLPLALRVAAERVSARPTTPLADLVAELRGLRRRLDLLDAGGDPRAAPRAVFSWSYQHLQSDAARAFRLLGVHPGSDLDAYAAAALTNTTLDDAQHLLDLLVGAHLVQPVSSGRYGMHDLLRAYTTHLAATEDTDEELRAASGRLFDYYLATAAAAMNTLHPAEAHRRPRVPPVTTQDPTLANPTAARAWLDAERRNLIVVVAYAADHGWPTHTIRLAGTLYRYLGGGQPTEALTVHGFARRAARQIGDPVAEAHALIGLGGAHAQLARYEQAANDFEQALALFRQAGDRDGESRVLGALGSIHERLGRYEQAADHHRRVLTLFRQAGDQVGQARALASLGVVDWRMGRYSPAAEYLQHALTLFRQAGDREGEADVLNRLGLVEQRLGRHQQAGDHHEQALALYRQLGNRRGQAVVLGNLGTAFTRLGQPERATDYHGQALTLLREMGNRDVEAWVLNGLGEAAQAAGHPADALTWHAAAHAVAIDIGSPDQQARADAGLGHAHVALGDPVRARQHYQHAVALYTDLGQPDADDIRAHLATLVNATSSDGDGA